MNKTDWTKPQSVDGLTVAFPAKVSETLLPLIADVPDEFKQYENRWSRFVSKLFFDGGKLPPVKAGVDAESATRHLSAVLRSFEPKHEDKIAGAAWLASMWFEACEL